MTLPCFRTFLIQEATGGSADDAEYRQLHETILNHSLVKGFAPASFGAVEPSESSGNSSRLSSGIASSAVSFYGTSFGLCLSASKALGRRRATRPWPLPRNSSMPSPCSRFG